MFSSNIFRNILTLKNCSKTLIGTQLSSLAPVQTQELDKLFKTIVVEVRSHDRAILNSYEYFTKTAANHLDIKINKIIEPVRHHERRTLLKSAFIYKKHRVQYEFRTYFRVFEFKHLTGSTADTFLEYIQRNLPEGVAMKVTKHRIEKVPDTMLQMADGEQS